MDLFLRVVLVSLAGVLTVGILAHSIFVRLSPGRAAKSWQRFAQAMASLRVRMKPGDGIMSGPPVLEGTFRGIPVVCELYSRRLTNSRGMDPKYGTRVVATCRRQLPPGFKLERQGALAAIGKVFGNRDIELGEEAFDDAFVVGGVRSDIVMALLSDPAIRQTLTGLLARERDLTVDGGTVVVQRKGATTNHSDLTSMFDVATVAVLALEHAAASLGA